MLNNNKINVAMLELSDQNKAVLEFYFDSAGESLYTLVDKAKADVFITDYDYPGAKDYVATLLSEQNKPVMILSVREQDLASTLWLAKPLSAKALTDATTELNQMIADSHNVETVKAVEAVKVEETTEATIAEVKAAEIKILEETTTTETDNAEELVLPTSPEIITDQKEIEEKTDSDDMSDIFNLLEEDKQADNSQKIEKRLAMAGTGALISASAAYAGGSNNDDATHDHQRIDASAELKELIEEDSRLDFTDLSMEDNEETHAESEGEVDALLESLILGEGNKTHKNKEITEPSEETGSIEKSSDDIFLESLNLDDTEDLGDIESLDQIDSKDELLELPVIEDIDLLEEGIEVEVESRLLIEEKESILIDENFTIHDDLAPSEEDIFADTLQVGFKDTKKEDLEVEKIEFSNSAIDDADIEVPTNIDGSLDLDLLNFNLESNDHNNKKIAEDVIDNSSNSLSDNTSNKSEEITLELLDDTPDSVVNDDDNNSDIANFDNFDSSIDLEQFNVTEVKQVKGENLADDHLDNLLQEVSLETDSYIETKQKTPEVLSSVSIPSLVVPPIEEDFVAIDEATPDSPVVDKDNEEFDLQSLLNQVRKEATDTGKGNTGLGGSSEKPSAFEQTNAEKRWLQLCGNYKKIEKQADVAKLSFVLKDHLLGVLLKQIETVKGSEKLYRLKYHDLIIVLDHSKDSIYCNVQTTKDEFSEVCFSEIDHKNIKIHDLDYSEVRLYRKKITENPDRAHTVESFIWSTSLLTSRGRLPENTNITKKVGLKVWPNLTRVELTPHAMHIAAVFSKNPGSLLEVAEWLNTEQRYVFAFYNAALSLDMMELDSSKLKKSSFSLGKKNKSEERSFFSRLMKRLKS